MKAAPKSFDPFPDEPSAMKDKRITRKNQRGTARGSVAHVGFSPLSDMEKSTCGPIAPTVLPELFPCIFF
jgi:hypothetical protein